MKKLIVYGAGEFGSLIANVLSYHNDLQIAAYGDDDPQKTANHMMVLQYLGRRICWISRNKTI